LFSIKQKSLNMTKHVVVWMADGSEEIEAVTAIDVLRRAKCDVKVVSTTSEKVVTCSRGVRVQADCKMDEINQDTLMAMDAWVFPGGLGGAESFCRNDKLLKLFNQYAQGEAGVIAAICAGVLVWEAAGVAKGVKFTCYPGVKERFGKEYVDMYQQNKEVVVDGRYVSGCGPAVALQWALMVVEVLLWKEEREKVATPMLTQ
jgi:4-methyl-5(b-hydroxyethyl)-thiazole monophosphate biosynthesis